MLVRKKQRWALGRKLAGSAEETESREEKTKPFSEFSLYSPSLPLSFIWYLKSSGVLINVSHVALCGEKLL